VNKYIFKIPENYINLFFSKAISALRAKQLKSLAQ